MGDETRVNARADEAAQRFEEQARIILESITDAFFALGRDWRFTYINRKAEELLGRTREDLLGKNLWEEYAPAIGTEFDRSYHRAMDENVTVTFEEFYAPHDRWYEVNTYPSSEGLSVYFRDINERRRTEERDRRAAAEAIAAAEANAKFRTFFEQGTNFAGVMTLDGTVVEANRLCLDACGFTRDEIIGRKFWECGWWNRSPALVEMVREGSLQAAAGQLFRRETPYFVADGSERFVDLIIAPVTDEAGRVLFVAPTGTDITDRKRTEEDLRRLAADLAEADRRKDEFLATLAHELRNPLAPLRNGLQILKLAGEDGQAVEQARTMMDRQLSQMVRLVDDLLDVSRITRNRLELRVERVDLASVVSHAVEAVRPLCESRGHELAAPPPPEPMVLNADPVRLSQVIGNLLNNACKFTPRGGHIGLTVEREGEQAVVRVRDDGIGITGDQLARIFDLFVQVDTSLERSVSGLGIGLTLVKNLVELHGGTVSVHSAGAGQGSEFVVCLPLRVEAPLGQSSPPPGETVPTAARRILVVDDNRDAATSLAELLELTGNETRTAYDGLEALEAAASFRPDVVLLDIGMPKMNGYDAARTIREQPWGKNILLLALTGWGQDEDRQKSKDAGFNDHLVKPVEFATLTKLLAELREKPSCSA